MTEPPRQVGPGHLKACIRDDILVPMKEAIAMKADQ